MKPLFLGLAILASTVRAIPVNMPNARAFEETGTASATLSKRQDDWDVWRNELTNVAGVGCKPITVIFARGTIELGNVGDLVGPPFFDDLDDLIGADNIAVQGVDYPATIGGYLIGGDLGGAQTTADLLNQAANNCPDTKIVLSGYSVRIFGAHVSPFEPKHEPRDMSRKFLLSEHAFRFHTPPWIGNADRETIIQQGAMEVHLGEAMVSAEVAAQIAAVVVFGDPFKGRPFPNVDPSKVMTYCFNDDFICDDLPVVDTYHLEYIVDTPAAAAFVQGLVSY